MPGKYKARLTVDGESVEQEFEIIKDPRLPNTPEDYQQQFEFITKVRDKVSEAHLAIKDIRSIRKDINYLQEKLGKEAEYKEVIEMAKELDKEMGVIENNIHQTKNRSRQDPLNYGIRVNNLVPGMIMTDRITQLSEDRAQKQGLDPATIIQEMEAPIPLGRFGTTEEFGRTGAFLLSDAASYANGVSYFVDGGLSRTLW